MEHQSHGGSKAKIVGPALPAGAEESLACQLALKVPGWVTRRLLGILQEAMTCLVYIENILALIYAVCNGWTQVYYMPTEDDLCVFRVVGL